MKHVSALCTAKRDCKREPNQVSFFFFFCLHCKCFILPWQPHLPGGSSKTPPNTTAKEVHLARLLPGMSWPTLKPRLHNQKAELAWSSFTFHPSSHHILSPQTRMGGSTGGGGTTSFKECPCHPFTVSWSHSPICGWITSPQNAHGHSRPQWSFGGTWL